MSKQGDYFVMLITEEGGYTPLVIDDGWDELATFHSEEEAREAALSSPLGDWFGYEIFERGMGTC